MASCIQHQPFAARLIEARDTASPISPADCPSLTIDQAYEVQQELTRQKLEGGERIAGWKVGLTSAPSMAAFGASEPIAGPMFAKSVFQSGETLERKRFCDARVEGEVLIEIGEKPPATSGDDRLLASIACIRPAIEIADSRVIGWPSSAALAIADDACCGWVVLGPARDPRGLNLAAIEMQMAADGDTVSNGTGVNCLGNPLFVYRWFLNQADKFRWQVSPGDLLLTGALGPPMPAAGIEHFQASLSGLGYVDIYVTETDDL